MHDTRDAEVTCAQFGLHCGGALEVGFVWRGVGGEFLVGVGRVVVFGLHFVALEVGFVWRLDGGFWRLDGIVVFGRLCGEG